jgi:hypothetical protein
MEAWLKCWFSSLPPPPLGGNIREVWLNRTFTHTPEKLAATSSAGNFVCYGTGSSFAGRLFNERSERTWAS